MQGRPLASGLAVSPGKGVGHLHVDVDDALDEADEGRPVVLAIHTTSPRDVAALMRSGGVLTVAGGHDSHAAVVTRASAIPAVLSVEGMIIADDHVMFGTTRVDVGELVEVDGTTGSVGLADGSGEGGQSLSLDEAYALETPDDSRRLYGAWASTYESDFVDATGYIYPRKVAEQFVSGFDGSGPVLDVGCGTGVVGEELNDLGVEVIDGIDISPEMLSQAREKGSGGGVYRHLIEADFTEETAIPAGTYAGVVSAGTFTHGHLSPHSLGELIRVCAPGARGAIGINTVHFESHGFRDWFEAAVRDGRILRYEAIAAPIYASSSADTANGMAQVVVFEVA